jgi:hypothetical protein
LPTTFEEAQSTHLRKRGVIEKRILNIYYHLRVAHMFVMERRMHDIHRYAIVYYRQVQKGGGGCHGCMLPVQINQEENKYQSLVPPRFKICENFEIDYPGDPLSQCS